MKHLARTTCKYLPALLIVGSVVSTQLPASASAAASCTNDTKNWTTSSQLSYPNNASFCLEAGSTEFIFQTDGNFVDYYKGKAVGASNTTNVGRKLILQSDGNVVVYDSGNHAKWAAGRFENLLNYSLFISNNSLNETSSNGGSVNRYITLPKPK